MKFEIKIIGDSSSETDRRVAREVMALLNSTSVAAVSAASAAPIPTPDNGDGDETPNTAYQPGEVDVTGLPWDERIHSGGKTKTDKGVWRTKKGVSDELVASVTAELRARLVPVNPVAAPIATPIPVATPITSEIPPPAPVAPVPMPAAAPIPVPEPVAPVPMPAATPIPVPEPVAPVAAPAPTPAPGAMDFPTLMGLISAGVTAGKIDGTYLAAVAKKYELGDNIGALAARPDLIPTVHAQLMVDGKL